MLRTHLCLHQKPPVGMNMFIKLTAQGKIQWQFYLLISIIGDINTSSSSGSTVVSSCILWFSIVFGTSFGGAYKFAYDQIKEKKKNIKKMNKEIFAFVVSDVKWKIGLAEFTCTRARRLSTTYLVTKCFSLLFSFLSQLQFLLRWKKIQYLLDSLKFIIALTTVIVSHTRQHVNRWTWAWILCSLSFKINELPGIPHVHILRTGTSLE